MEPAIPKILHLWGHHHHHVCVPTPEPGRTGGGAEAEDAKTEIPALGDAASRGSSIIQQKKLGKGSASWPSLPAFAAMVPTHAYFTRASPPASTRSTRPRRPGFTARLANPKGYGRTCGSTGRLKIVEERRPRRGANSEVNWRVLLRSALLSSRQIRRRAPRASTS